MPRPSEDWLTLLEHGEQGAESGEALGMIERISRRGRRLRLSHLEGGSGTVDQVFFDEDDVEIDVLNCTLPTLSRRDFDLQRQVIMLRALLSCDITFKVEGHAPMAFNRPELTLVCVPKGLRFSSEVAGGVHQQGIIGVFTPESFTRAYGLQPEDLPEVLRDAVVNRRAVGRIVSLPLEHRVAQLVADTIDTPLEGEARALQYRGRLAELVAYAMSAMQRAAPRPSAVALRHRDADLARLTLQRLARDYRGPPATPDLARELGTNANKLRAAFKNAFGLTMSDYCLQRRMREAQQLLLEAKLSIAQIAERVGYEHQSGFAAAFSGHVGMSPSKYRQHRAPITVQVSEDL